MSRTLLLADDSVVIQKLVGLSFANEDIEIITVDNGDDAIAKAVEIKPDLVLADVVMPGLSGYEVCSSVRQNPELASIPVLLLTGTFEAFDEGRAQEVGSNGFITKPFEASALVERVSELLTESAAPAPAAEAPASSGFFDENLGDLGAPVETSAPLADMSQGNMDDFAFGSSELEPLAAEPDPASGDLIFPESSPSAQPGDSGLNGLLDSAGGDRTIAMMPEPAEATALDPILSPPPIIEPAPPTTQPIGSVSLETATSTPEGILLEDDFLAAPSTANPAETVLAADVFADPTPPAIPDANSGGDPLAAPIDDSSAISFDSEFGSTAPLPNRPSLDVDDLSFGAGDVAAGGNPASDAPMAPSADETVLAAEFFTDESASAPQSSAFQGTAPAPPPIAEPLQSNGLDLDFSEAPSTDSGSGTVFPENFDISSSDLGPELGENSISHDSVDPFAVTRPDPEVIATPTLAASPSAPFASEEGATTDRAVAVPDLSPMMRERIHDTLEKVAWEAFSDLSETIVRQVLERVEKVAWEVIPQMAETMVQEEIRRMKGDGKE